MSENIVAVGEKVHVITRRLFDGDVRRHFAGSVVASSCGSIRVEGHAFVLHGATNEYHRRPERRSRVFSLSDSVNIINVVPEGVRLDQLTYQFASGKLVMTDGAGFQFELTEFGSEV